MGKSNSIFWSVREKQQVLSSGFFHCPSCLCEKFYRRTQIYTQFAMFLIPIWRTASVIDIVCSSCKDHFSELVLQLHPKDEFAEIGNQIRRMIVCFMVAANRIDTDELLALCDIWEAMFQAQIEPNDLGKDIRDFQSNGAAPTELAAVLGQEIDDATKRKALEAIECVFKHTKPMTQEHKQLFFEVARSLHVDLSQYQLNFGDD